MDTVVIAVVGGGSEQEPARLLQVAAEVGAGIARAGAMLICGGLGGVMAAAAEGAHAAGGVTVGLLPGAERGAANPSIDVAIPTGMGELRNGLIVRSADAVIAIGGEYGTLSEIALALKLGRPVVGIQTWELRRAGRTDAGIEVVADAGTAVAAAMAAADRTPRSYAGGSGLS